MFPKHISIHSLSRQKGPEKALETKILSIIETQHEIETVHFREF